MQPNRSPLRKEPQQAAARTSLLWSRTLRDQLSQHVQAGYPAETCGLLLGRNHPGGAVAMRLETARNLEQACPEQRFELSPEDQYRIERQAQASGLEVIGVWHSHPNGSPRPSAHDLKGAWEGYSYVIASVDAGGLEQVEAWRLDGESFRPELLVEQPF